MTTATQVHRVSVHRNGALVARRGVATSTRVEVTGLPLLLASETLRIRADVGVVLDVEETCTVEDAGQAPAVEMAEMARLRRTLEDLRGRIASVDVLLRATESLAPPAPASVPGLDMGWLPEPRHWVAFHARAGERARALDEERIRLARELAACAERLSALESEARAAPPEARFSRGVRFTLAGATPPVAFEIEYFVEAARWVPAYRLDVTGGRARLVLGAQVAQASGEDWSGVELHVSTAELHRETTLPEVGSWRMGRAQAGRRPAWRPLPADLPTLFNAYDRGRQGAVPGRPSDGRNVAGVILHLPDGSQRGVRIGPSGITVGRGKHNDVVLETTELSRQHLRFVERQGRTVVMDLGSGNGTYVNGVRIPGAHVLAPDDVVTVGRFRMVAVASELALGAVPPAQGRAWQQEREEEDVEESGAPEADEGMVFGAASMAPPRDIPAPAAPPPMAQAPRSMAKMAAPAMARRSAPPPSGGGGPPGSLPPEPAPAPEPAPTRMRHALLRLAGPDEPNRGTLQPVDPLVNVEWLLTQRTGVDVDMLNRAILSARGALHRLRTAPLPAGGATSDATHFHHVYRVPAPAQVPSDGSWHGVTAFVHNAPATIEHRSVPRESLDVYRFCVVPVPADVPLPAGGMQVFVEGAFTVNAPFAGTGGARSLALNLGVDPAVRITARTVHAQQAEKGLVAQSSRVEHRVKTSALSTAADPVTLVIHDRLPHPAENEKDVEVALVSSSPPPERPTEGPDGMPLKGALRWTLKLAANQPLHVEHLYTVTVPAKLEVVGGNRRE